MPRSDGPDPDWTDWEAEGAPDTEEQPPGVTAETAVEGDFPPHDQPIAATEWGTTAREESLGESLADRVARERPDFGESDGLGETAEPIFGEGTAGDALSPEEKAMHVTEEP